MKKRNALLCILSAATFVLTACGQEETIITPTEIVVKSEGNVTKINVNETLQFSATVLPEDSEQLVQWSVVKIDGDATISESGLLTATKAGKVEVVAASYIDKELKGKATLTIVENEPQEVLPTGIKIVGSTKELKVDETTQLAIRVTPENATNKVTYSSSDQTIATVSATGAVKALKAGKATITAASTVVPTIKDTYEITVVANEGGETPNPTVDWSKVEVSTMKRFIDAEKETALKVEGKCVATTPVSKGKYGAYLQNGKAGAYVYLEENQKVEVGKAYLVGGIKQIPYNGIIELADIQVLEEITKTINIETTTITPEITSTFDTAKEYLYGNVNLTKVTPIELETKESKAYSIRSSFGDKEVALRVDPSTCLEGEFNKINKKLENWMIGTSMEVSNLLVTCGGYSGKISASYNIRRADDIKILPLTDVEILEIASNNLDMPNFLKAGDDVKTLLPKTIENIEGITVEYTYDGEIIGTDGIVKGAELPTLATVKATLKKGKDSLTKDYKIAIDGSKELANVYTFDLEDAEADKEGGYGTSPTKPSYKEGDVTLGTPTKAKWTLKNTLIGSSNSDRKEGKFSMRMQLNSNATESGRIELKQDFDFGVLEFAFATYGNDALGATITVSYSTDSGSNWTEDAYTFKSNSKTLETVRVSLHKISPTNRVAINIKPGLGKRVNVDNVKLLK